MAGLTFAVAVRGGDTTWRWVCEVCKAQGLIGQSELMVHEETAKRNAVRHNQKRHDEPSSIEIVVARIDAVRKFCQDQIDYDASAVPVGALTDRAWAAQGVLNILDGKVDWQLRDERGEH